MYKPKDEGKFPVIILSHGYNGKGADFDRECIFYAEHGYICYNFDFCGGSIYSKSSGKSTDMTIFTEKEDLLVVFDYIYEMDCIEKDHIYLFGGSQGGLVTALVAEEKATKIKAMALYYPAICIPDDWRNRFPELSSVPKTIDFWGLRLGEKYITSIHDFNFFTSIGKYDKNVYIIHGDNDEIVPLSYSEKLVEKYSNSFLKVLHNEGHGFSLEGGKIAMNDVLNFFENNK